MITTRFTSTIIVSYIFFTLTVDNLQLNCEQCNRTNPSEKGLTQHMWMKQFPGNMENVPKGHFIHSILNNIWTVNSKHHTTTDHTRRHMKSHARDNLNINALCEREVLSRNHSKRHSKTISE